MKANIRQGIAGVCAGTASITVSALGALFFDAGGMFYYIISPLALICAAGTAALDGQKHKQAARILFAGAVLILSVELLYIAYHATGLDDKFNDFDALRSFIIESGFWGYLIFIGLTVFQVVVLPIPEAVTILLGVAIYGATLSFILSVLGTVLGALISFFLGRVFGRKLCSWMFGEINTEKYARILAQKGRLPFIIMLLFPAFPDDMLCMIAGITDMTYAYFTLVVTLTRPVMIGLTAYLGSGIIPFSGEGIAVWVAIACILFLLFAAATYIKGRIERRALYKRT